MRSPGGGSLVWAWLVLWLITSAVGCSETAAPTEVVVEIDADRQVIEAMSELHLEVWSAVASCTGSGCWSTRLTDDYSAATQSWPVRFPVLPLAGDETRVFEVIARALDSAGNVLVEQRAVSGFVPGGSARLVLALGNLCVELAGSCEPNRQCHGPLCTTCREGKCEKVGRYRATPDGELQRVVDEADDVMSADEAGAGSVSDAGGMDGEGDVGGGTADGCEGDTWDHDDDSATRCEARTRCHAGQFASQDVPGEDRVCRSCASGSFSARNNTESCTRWTSCAPGTYVSNTPSATKDRICSACAPGTVSTQANQASCLPEGSCEAGTYQVTPGSATMQPVCEPCSTGTYCAGGSAAPEPCAAGSWDHDQKPSTTCTAHRRCLAGQFVSSAGDATTDRVCTTCTNGSFSTVENATKCTAWTPCGTGFMQGTPGSAVADRTCVAAPWYHQFGSADEDYSDQGVVDGNGNVYVAGNTFDAITGQTYAGSTDAYVRKVNSVGTEAWTRQFGTSGQEWAHGVSVDPSGNVYVIGITDSALPDQSALGSFDAFVRKYDSAGVEQWTRQFGTSSGDYGYGVAADGRAVYVAGYTEGAFSGFTNAGGFGEFVRKYDSAGNVVWTRQFAVSSFGFSPGGSLAIDGDGNVFLAGLTNIKLPGQTLAGGTDTYVRKYDSGGTEQWTRQFGTASADETHGISADSAGNVYVVGHTTGALSGTNAGSADAFVRKYNSGGTAQWTRQFGTSSWDQLNSVKADGTGAYVAGYTGGTLPDQTTSGGSDVVVRHYDTAGAEQWTRQIGTSSGDLATGVGVDTRGNVYASGRTDGAFPAQPAARGTDVFVLRIVP